jgi:hypothetical protein
MHNQLTILRNAVALESLSMRDMTAYFHDIMPSLHTSFKDFVGRFNPKQQPIQGFTSQQREFEKELGNRPFMTISQITAYIPEGLDVPYIDYAEVLLDAVKHASRVMDVLVPYTAYLAELVTDKQAVLSTKSFEAEFKLIEAERKRINEELGACFKKGSSKAEAAIGDVVQRNADWPQVFQRCNDIMTAINDVNRSSLLKKVNECNTYLEIILKMAREGKVGKVAGSAVLNLADGAYQVASELEFYAVAYYKAEVFVGCVNQTVEHFKKVTNTTDMKGPK